MIYEITDLSIPELNIYREQNENRLKRFYEPAPGIFIAESPNVIERALQGGYSPISFLIDKQALHDKDRSIFTPYDVPVYIAESSVFAEIMGYPMTRGFLCAMRRRELPTLEEICNGKSRIAVLESVMNPTNVGAIFRSAAALNMEAVLLVGGCSDPLYRRCVRVSMGTVFQVPWTILDEKKYAWQENGPAILQKLGFQTAAMALSDNSVSIDDPVLSKSERLAVILGTEGEGLSEHTIQSSDYTVKIPMAHGVDSLNVAAASAVAFWQLRKM